ncbi:MAG: protein jag [Firmicutes bacterium]|nr:protein jag [Dethiobacter sp.]MBS3888831.1 protein jag [Bacillota bacterium]MBS4054964.1 protein jag [Thermaerobacter sp.]
MLSVEKTAKSVEEAIQAALLELGLVLEQVEVTVLEEPTKGVFGLWGVKPARILVTKRLQPEDKVIDFVLDLVAHMGAKEASCTIVRETADEVEIAVGCLNTGMLIGKRGQTLDAIQQLAAVIYSRVGGDRRLLVDIGQYRERRKQTLVDLSKSLAERVRSTGRKAILEPMSAAERRIVHMTLQDEAGIVTYSEGDEPYRKVIIAVR